MSTSMKVVIEKMKNKLLKNLLKIKEKLNVEIESGNSVSISKFLEKET
jgi:hypothetical protein